MAFDAFDWFAGGMSRSLRARSAALGWRPARYYANRDVMERI